MFLARFDLTMVAKGELEREEGARSRARLQWRRDGLVRRSKKGKNEDQGSPFNLGGEADQPFNGKEIILTLPVAEK